MEFADGTNPWTAEWLPLALMLAVGMILYLIPGLSAFARHTAAPVA
jgi:hypothetical protein